MKKFCLVLFVSISMLLVGGCVKTYYTGTAVVPESTEFEVIPNAKLALSVVGSRQLVSGIDDSITFKLDNLGEEIRIPEWQVKDIDNLIIYYQPWIPGTEDPNPQSWIKIEPIVLQPIQRYPLSLRPNSSVILKAALPFLEDLKVTPGKERRFFIKASLNLKSVKANSKVYAISVL